MKPASIKPVRCAIYTRVSTEHGLDQEFNSLDAQYDAASAYIKSQAHAGWTRAIKYDHAKLPKNRCAPTCRLTSAACRVLQKTCLVRQRHFGEGPLSSLPPFARDLAGGHAFCSTHLLIDLPHITSLNRS